MWHLYLLVLYGGMGVSVAILNYAHIFCFNLGLCVCVCLCIDFLYFAHFHVFYHELNNILYRYWQSINRSNHFLFCITNLCAKPRLDVM